MFLHGPHSVGGISKSHGEVDDGGVERFDCSGPFAPRTQHEACKNTALCEEIRICCAGGGWIDELRDIAAVQKKHAALVDAGFSPVGFPGGRTPRGEREEKWLAEIFFKFNVFLMAERARSLVNLEWSLPWAAAGLLDPKPGARARHFDKFRSWWTALERLERECQGELAAVKFRCELGWPCWPWALRLFTELVETDFVTLSNWDCHQACGFDGPPFIIESLPLYVESAPRGAASSSAV